MSAFVRLSRRQGSRRAETSSSASTTATATSTDASSSTAAPNSTPTPPAPPPANSSTPPQSSGSKTGIMAIAIAVVVGIFAILFAFYVVRQIRKKHKNPKYVPTKYLKKRWEKWEPSSTKYRLPETNDHLEPTGGPSGQGVRRTGSARPPSSFPINTDPPVADTTAAGVDRNTSVRSVMTLPAYNQTPSQNEQVLGREGERGGIDVVIEHPETIDEEEQHREAEMEALYQVRLARRRENEEREERRRLRREARERGDYVALRELQAQANATSTTNRGRTVEELRAEHDRIKKERQRAVSSVSYGDLGVARHDGTRLRANSDESERQGLLGDAASMATSRISNNTFHRRDRSASSILSIDTTGSDFPSPGLTRSRGNSRAESPFMQSTDDAHNEGRAGSSPEVINHEDFPPNSPPGYENISLSTPQAEVPRVQYPVEPPPDYSSPIAGRGEGPDLPSRRTSRTGSLLNSRRISTASNSSTTMPNAGERRASWRLSRGLPSLRLSSLPSIHVEPGSPVVGGGEGNDTPDNGSQHHPEE